MYLNLKSFFSVIAEFSWNWVCSILHQKWRSDLNFIFSTSLKKSVYYMMTASHKYKKRFDLMISFFLIVTMFLICWIKTKTFWIQNLSLIMIIFFSMSSFKLKNSISFSLNCLLNSLLTSVTARTVVTEMSARFAVFITAITAAVIFSIIWVFFFCCQTRIFLIDVVIHAVSNKETRWANLSR